MAVESVRSQLHVVEGLKGVQFAVVRPNPHDTRLAETVSGWTKGGKMLPKEPGEIADLFAGGRSVVLFDAADGKPVSHAAASILYGTSVEVGAMCTAPDKQRMGGGTASVRELLRVLDAEHPDKTPFALANEASLPIFLRLGGKIIEDPKQLDDKVWEYCLTECPVNKLKPAGTVFSCCDTPVDLTPVRR